MTDEQNIKKWNDTVDKIKNTIFSDGECSVRIFRDDFFKLIDILNRQKAEIERLKAEKAKLHRLIPKMIKESKSEAIKEFAERLKEWEIYMRVEFPNTKTGTECYIVLSEDIDILVKEMTEDKLNG